MDDTDKIEELLKVKFETVVKKLASKADALVSELITDSVTSFVLNDAAWNIAGEIEDRATKIVAELLKGDTKYLQRYSLAKGEKSFNDYVPGEYDYHGVRRKLVEDHMDFLQNEVIQDLLKENKSLRSKLSFYEER